MKKLWHDSLAAGFFLGGKKMGFCFEIFLGSPFSICGIANQNSFQRGEKKTDNGLLLWLRDDLSCTLNTKS